MSKTLTIKLISPRMSLRNMDTEIKRRMSPSLSLVTIASLTPAPHIVYIEDENLNQLKLDDQPDLVGINVNVDTSDRAFEISKQYRNKGVKVIFGGIHASADPKSMLPHCDSVCIGEAEEIWHKILEDVQNNCLQKTYQYKGVTDLSKYPIPNWNYIDKKNYLYHNVVITSRGCPFKCEFCYNSCDYITNPYRNRPVEEVIKEIKLHKSKQIMFIDDNLTGNLNWFEKFLDAIKPLKINWHGASSASLVHHPQLIEKMARCGCRSLFIGFESINPDSISSVNKKQNNIKNYETLISMLHSNNIMVNASLAFGFDFDTQACFQSTLDWLVRNKIETMTAHILTPYPGTKLYGKLKKENRITESNSILYNTSNVVFQPKLISAIELKKGYLWMYENFYSVKNIWKRRPSQLKLFLPYLVFNFGYRKFGKLTAFIGKLGLMNQIGIIARKLSYGIG